MRKLRSGPAPRLRAAISSRGSIPWKARRIARTMSGKLTTTEAMAAAHQVNTTLTPNQANSSDPTGPRGLKQTSSR